MENTIVFKDPTIKPTRALIEEHLEPLASTLFLDLIEYIEEEDMYKMWVYTEKAGWLLNVSYNRKELLQLALYNEGMLVRVSYTPKEQSILVNDSELLRYRAELIQKFIVGDFHNFSMNVQSKSEFDDLMLVIQRIIDSRSATSSLILKVALPLVGLALSLSGYIIKISEGNDKDHYETEAVEVIQDTLIDVESDTTVDFTVDYDTVKFND